MTLQAIWADKKFIRQLFSLAAPITAQQFIIVALGMVDVLMIGQLGETEVAAVGLADQLSFLFFLLMFGISSGAAIFTAQYWGQKDVPRIRSVLGVALFMALVSGLGFTVIAFFFSQDYIAIYSTDPAVITEAGNYLRVVAVSFVFMAVSINVSAVLRSMEQVKLPLYISVAALSLNTFLNYGLILGNFGWPQLGVQGAAIATTISRVLEGVVLVSAVYLLKMPLAGHWSAFVRVRLIPLAKFFRTITPVVLTEMVWSLGITTYYVAYARIGTDAIAAVNIATSIDRVLFVLFIGMGSAGAVMVGNLIGAADIDRAITYAKRLLIIAPLLAVMVGAVLLLLIPLLLSLYNVAPQTLVYARNILILMAFFLVVRSMNFMVLVGVLRSGGDTRYVFFMEAGTVWLVGVPLALLGAFVWKLPVHMIFLLVMVEEVVKVVLGLLRIRSMKWINRLTAV